MAVEFGVNPIWLLRVKLGAKCCGKPDRGARRAFPVVKRLVGDKYFHAMANVFLLREPPFSPLLIHYGETFAAFVEEFEAAKPLPYLADVARLEYARGLPIASSATENANGTTMGPI